MTESSLTRSRWWPWAAAWQFSRPHTIVGTSLSLWSLFALAVMPLDVAQIPWEIALWAWLACLGGNVYIVGLNQILDIPIDRINKPHLPLAAGDFTLTQAWGIVITTGILALGIGAWQGPMLWGVVGLSLIIGTAYSVPPVRLKRYPFWAALCILGVRGVIVNLGLFWHFRTLIGQTGSLPPLIWALTGFVVVFSVAIALCKDIPDVAGDQQFDIGTLTVRWGPKMVFRLTVGILTLAYGGLLLWSLGVDLGVNLAWLWLSHGGLLLVLWGRAVQVDLADMASITQFYQFIWRLFFLEYLLVPLLAWGSQV